MAQTFDRVTDKKVQFSTDLLKHGHEVLYRKDGVD
jgi:hypothetical protein